MQAKFVANVGECRCCGQVDESSCDRWVVVMQEMLGNSRAVRCNTAGTLAELWHQS